MKKPSVPSRCGQQLPEGQPRARISRELGALRNVSITPWLSARGNRADRVDERPSRSGARGARIEDSQLERRQLPHRLGARAPAQIWARLQRPKATARRIDQDAVKVAVASGLRRVCLLHADATGVHPGDRALERLARGRGCARPRRSRRDRRAAPRGESSWRRGGAQVEDAVARPRLRERGRRASIRATGA